MDPAAAFHHLRGTLRANAAFSATGGLVALVGFAPIDSALGVGNRLVVAATGAGLLAFAGLVVAVAAFVPRRLLRDTLAVSIADLSWVATTAVVLATADLDQAAPPLLGGVAMVVAGFAVAQLRLRTAASRLTDLDSPVPERVHVERRLAAAASDVWPLLTDHDLYARLAPNLSRVDVLGGEGAGMQRRCYDTLGRGWNETCTLWDEGRQFAVDVDTSDYPYPLQEMRGRWAVEPDGDRSTVSMDFELVPRPGVLGGVFLVTMLVAFKPIVRRIVRGWERELTAVHAAA
ncbi:MAG: SRPBCC family protein [Acidimicrobiales bacterium]